METYFVLTGVRGNQWTLETWDIAVRYPLVGKHNYRKANIGDSVALSRGSRLFSK
jgi:hypothetical protein